MLQKYVGPRKNASLNRARTHLPLVRGAQPRAILIRRTYPAENTLNVRRARFSARQHQASTREFRPRVEWRVFTLSACKDRVRRRVESRFPVLALSVVKRVRYSHPAYW